jgi:transposase
LKGRDPLSDIQPTLFVGIDVAKDANRVHAMNFDRRRLAAFSTPNDQDGASRLETQLLSILRSAGLTRCLVVIESTGIYSAHIATYLSASLKLAAFEARIYLINPKISRNYRESFADMDKTDPANAYLLADLARVGRTDKLFPFRGSQKPALQRLTRHRMHMSELITAEKGYALNNIFLKFSAFDAPQDGKTVFFDTFAASAISVLTEFRSTDEIVDEPLEDLATFLIRVSHNRLVDPLNTAELLQKAARASYRLDQTAYDPINVALASSLNCLDCFRREIKDIDQAIALQVKGFSRAQYLSLASITGIGPVYASGILAEIGDISQFRDEAALAKYASLTWRKRQSGHFEAENTFMTKTGNAFLRYYLCEAANSVHLRIDDFKRYYKSKYDEVTTHQHKRALALTARKLVRLVYGLMNSGRLYQ